MSDDATSGFPPPGTSLFVIDKLDELIDKQSPRDVPEDPEEKQKRGNKPPESLLNYWKTVHHVIRMLNKFAAKHNVAVVVLTPIDVKQERMCPAIDTQAWEMGVTTRIMLWRQDMGERNQDVRLGRTVKKDGVVGKGEVFGFNVTEVCGMEVLSVDAEDEANSDRLVFKKCLSSCRTKLERIIPTAMLSTIAMCRATQSNKKQPELKADGMLKSPR